MQFKNHFRSSYSQTINGRGYQLNKQLLVLVFDNKTAFSTLIVEIRFNRKLYNMGNKQSIPCIKQIDVFNTTCYLWKKQFNSNDLFQKINSFIKNKNKKPISICKMELTENSILFMKRKFKHKTIDIQNIILHFWFHQSSSLWYPQHLKPSSTIKKKNSHLNGDCSSD